MTVRDAEIQSIARSVAPGDSSAVARATGDADPDARSGEAPSPAALRRWEAISFGVAHAFTSVVLVCFGVRGLAAFGRWFGTMEWLINHRRRRRFRRALDRVMEQRPTAAQRRRWSRDHFIRTRCDKLLYLGFDRIPRDVAVDMFSISDRPLLDRSLSRGNGVYIALSHHGPHHLAAMLMALHGYRVAGVRDRREGASRRFVQSRFDRLYPEFQRMRVLFADAYPRDIYRCLKEGYVLGSAMDVHRLRHANQRSQAVTVFGERRGFLTGPLRVALRCRTPVLQAFLLPDTGLRYRLEIVDTLLDPDRVSDEDSAVSAALDRYCRNVERCVRAHPSLITRIG